MTATMISDREYGQFSRFLESQCGILLGNNKQYLVKSRLSSLIETFKFDSLSTLLHQVINTNDRALHIAVIDAMTTNETLWFRDSYPFSILTDRILPEMATKGLPIKIWSAASASGQEPYSIAMSIVEAQQRRLRIPSNISITATDISTKMLKMSKLGIYDHLMLARGLSPERKRTFFDEMKNGDMQIKDSIKEKVHFKPHNLMNSYAQLGRFDIIFCRNVLIYFSPESKVEVLTKMAENLNPGGYLILGASESLIGVADKFEMIHCHPGIIYKRK